MDKWLSDLPTDIRARLVSFVEDTGSGIAVTDPEGFVQFLVEHSREHPLLATFLTVDAARLMDHVEQTGNAPSGIKVIKAMAAEGTTVEVYHGPMTFQDD